MSTSSMILAALAIFTILVSRFGTRGHWFHFRVGLALFALGALLGAAALITGVLAWRHGSTGGAIAAVLGALILLGPASAILTAIGKPMIHDVTTDLDDPPRFEAITVPPYDFGDAAKQRAAYLDLQPRIVPTAPPDTFARARTAAESHGWQIISARPETGTVEATATTGWFGFKDDILIRLRPVPEGTRIDLRSRSRVGKSDLGVNAKRIREYLKTF
jgi:hypothetical protein